MCEWGSSREEERGGVSQIQAAGIKSETPERGDRVCGLVGIVSFVSREEDVLGPFDQRRYRWERRESRRGHGENNAWPSLSSLVCPVPESIPGEAMNECMVNDLDGPSHLPSIQPWSTTCWGTPTWPDSTRQTGETRRRSSLVALNDHDDPSAASRRLKKKKAFIKSPSPIKRAREGLEKSCFLVLSRERAAQNRG